MKSFSLLRTNVGLTTNVKIIVDSNYNLYLDSIQSSIDLSNSLYKKFQFTKNNLYDEILPQFYNGLDSQIIFGIKYDNDNDIMFNTFDRQLDDLYIMGSEDITDNKYLLYFYPCKFHVHNLNGSIVYL